MSPSKHEASKKKKDAPPPEGQPAGADGLEAAGEGASVSKPPAPAPDPGASVAQALTQETAPLEQKVLVEVAATSKNRGPFETAVVRAQVFVSSMSIRYKIAGALVLVLCAAIASLGVVSFQQQKRTLTAEMERRAEALARQLASVGKTSILTQEDLGVYATIKDVTRSPDVLYAFVQDDRGKVFAHSDLSQKGRALTGGIDEAAMRAETPVFHQTLLGSERVLDAAVPIVSKLGEKSIRVGTARVGLSEAPLRAAVRAQGFSFLWIALAFVSLGLVISFGLGKVLTRQIVVLMTGMKYVSEGHFNRLVDVDARDEIGQLAETFNEMILSLREKLHMEKYLSRSTLQVIKKFRDEEHLHLGGERRHVAVLFSDVRGFTSMTEALDPAEVVELLNLYLNLQAEVVNHRGGIVDKFVGDEVMALFTDEDPEYHAALAAQEIHNFILSLNDARAKQGKRRLTVGIGLNAGEVILGNMGSERQMDYTAIGDPINTAARLCSAARPGQVIVSRTVAEKIAGRGVTRELDPILAKGKREPVAIFELLDIPGTARKDMRKKIDLAAHCVLGGVDEAYQIRLRDLSRGGCGIETNFPLAQGAEISVEFAIPGFPEGSRLRGVVRHLRRRDGVFRAGLRFEGLDEKMQHFLTEWIHQVDTRVTRAAAGGAAPPSQP